MGPNFHPTEASGSEEEDFLKYLPVYFYGLNPGHPGEDLY